MDVFAVACPNCAQQPGEECRWAEVVDHPRFHSERQSAAIMLASMGRGGDVSPGVEAVALGTIVDTMF